MSPTGLRVTSGVDVVHFTMHCLAILALVRPCLDKQISSKQASEWCLPVVPRGEVHVQLYKYTHIEPHNEVTPPNTGVVVRPSSSAVLISPPT